MTLNEIDPAILKVLSSISVKEALFRFDDPGGLVVLPSEIKKERGYYINEEALEFDKKCHRMSRLEFIMFVTSLT